MSRPRRPAGSWAARSAVAAAVAAALGAATPALAKPPANAPAVAAPVADPAPTPEPEAASQAAVIEELRARLEQLEAEVQAVKMAPPPPPPRAEVSHLSLMDDAKLRLKTYLDVGVFYAFGDGVAYVRDVGARNHPRAVVPWVFDGDPWANTINAQGDSADLGLSRTNLPRFDPIGSGGKPSFIVNTINLGLEATLGSSLFFEASVDFAPRQGRLGSPGDLVDIDLAYVEWIPFDTFDLHVFAGKSESTVGIEYRRRKAPDRYGVTPSIISRYTVGPLTGIKVRGSILDEAIGFNVALSNGSSYTEKFGHFFNELDSNAPKTLSGRLSWRLPLPFLVEIGASGFIGAQDFQPRDDVPMWLLGADLQLQWGDLEVRAEFIRTQAEGGDALGGADRVVAWGWYAEASYQLFTVLGVYARADQRHARLRAFPNAYFTNTLRATGGVRFDISFNLLLKLEYLRLQELDGPELDDDVVTSSLVLKL